MNSSGRSVVFFLQQSRQAWKIGGSSNACSLRSAQRLNAATSRYLSTQAAEIPDTLSRVGEPFAYPNEYPGQIYAFNWCLNGDGVTPLRKSAFRITKPLDLQVAGLDVPKKMPLAVKAAAASKIPEAGSTELSFDDFDQLSQGTRDLLSLSDHLYCPEGFVPGTRTAVRVITNSKTAAPDLLAYLERAPRQEPPESLPITVYVLEQPEATAFTGYAIEEIEVEVPAESENPWFTGREDDPSTEAKSVASVVVAGPKVDMKVIVAGIELSQKALAADELEREAKKEAEEKASA